MSPAGNTGLPLASGEDGASLMDALDASMPGISPGIYDAADFHAIAAIAYNEAGIVLPAGKAMLVYSRLSPLVRDSNCATFASYVMRIQEDLVERQKAVMALITQRTTFYREAHHFDHFAREVRPGYVQRLLSGGKVRLWSAGCASGEEAWAMLMTLLGDDVSQGEAIARADLRLLATDMATPAIAKARAATYRTEDMATLPAPLRRVWTRPQDDGTSIIAPVAQPLARFRALNLVGEWPMQWQFDTIFCRHVLGHFDDATKERLCLRLVEKLCPGGWLYLGAVDKLNGVLAEVLSAQGNGVFWKECSNAL